MRKDIDNELTIAWIYFYYTYFFSPRGELFWGVGVVLQLRINTVRTEHRTFHNSQNVRVITKLILQYYDSHRITITVVASRLYTLRYTYTRTLICTLVPMGTYMYGIVRIYVFSR